MRASLVEIMMEALYAKAATLPMRASPKQQEKANFRRSKQQRMKWRGGKKRKRKKKKKKEKSRENGVDKRKLGVFLEWEKEIPKLTEPATRTVTARDNTAARTHSGRSD
ncbi:uncharacterized protein LDX57_012977 [Aspergillus melleus]|uniref:uncharacterized protein n=1 Tax=Aspergillus melleus TaxID=138277 RepID=UPI001E8EDDAE|nr:uncharacterized protein LDX57_012977 [Aspergillus melleus]KAH8435348.1 hypothetical protein LDX57_012977 [Aspergillus melleus]